jgi:uncharacterized protein (TIGR02453 family)
MAAALDLEPVLRFLSQLRKNNNKQWFDANKAQYENAMDQFETLVAGLITGLGKLVDLDGVTPKNCIMRIYRDVRFSKDKSPYKTGLGANIATGGRKSGHVGYHLHLAPDGVSMVGGGLWEPTPEQLARFRKGVDRDAAALRRILASSAFKTHFGELMGDKLKTAPQGYGADHPAIDLLRQKQVCAMERFEDKVVVSARFPALALEGLKAMKPFIDYLDDVVS